jgi:CBS domain-containing protein
MARTVYTCRIDDSLQVVAELMRDLGCGCLPVSDEGDRPIGIVTHKDICDAAAREEMALAAVQVESAMSNGVVSCSPDEPVCVAVARMQEHRIHRLPVVDASGRLIGLLTLRGVARQLAAGADLGIGADEILGALVGMPAQPLAETTTAAGTAA